MTDLYVTGLQQFGERQADAYHAQLQNSFGQLAAYPKLAPERQEIQPPVRIHPVGSHLVIYREQPDGTILIISVQHIRADWQTNSFAFDE